MALRKIVHIDEEKCNGCGLCIPNCVEGALQIVDGKAKLMGDVYCDGLGACLGHCPQDAITVIERDADEFDEKAVEELQNSKKSQSEEQHSCPGSAMRMMRQEMQGHAHHGGGCPGSAMRQINRSEASPVNNIKAESQLRQWPVQLTLVSPAAPYFKNSDLLITADCVPYAYANYHNDFLRGKSVVVGCPKLDDVDSYVRKLTELIKINDLESITVLRMEVPCCGGMAMAAKTARDNSGINIPVKVVTIGIEGEVLKKDYI